MFEYRLTPAGLELLPALVGLAQWSTEWLCAGTAPMRFIERKSGLDLPKVSLHGPGGSIFGPSDIAIVAGPDADAPLSERLDRTAADRRGRQARHGRP